MPRLPQGGLPLLRAGFGLAGRRRATESTSERGRASASPVPDGKMLDREAGGCEQICGIAVSQLNKAWGVEGELVWSCVGRPCNAWYPVHTFLAQKKK
jgi:hypothetical protein